MLINNESVSVAAGQTDWPRSTLLLSGQWSRVIATLLNHRRRQRCQR